MSFAFNQVLTFFNSCALYRLRWPRPRTVGSGHGRSRRRRPWVTFARVRAHGCYTIRHGYASVSSHARGAPSRCCLLASFHPGAGARTHREQWRVLRTPGMSCTMSLSGQRPCPQWCFDCEFGPDRARRFDAVAQSTRLKLLPRSSGENLFHGRGAPSRSPAEGSEYAHAGKILRDHRGPW